MYKTLSPWAIGVKADTLAAVLEAAKTGGFDGLEVSAAQLADLLDQRGAETVKKMFVDARIRPAAFGLPVEWRKSDEIWRGDLDKLPRLAKAAASIGIGRCFTWVMPCSNERPMAQNRKFHIDRFKPIADVLAQQKIRLGLEFIGPKTLRESQ